MWWRNKIFLIFLWVPTLQRYWPSISFKLSVLGKLVLENEGDEFVRVWSSHPPVICWLAIRARIRWRLKSYERFKRVGREEIGGGGEFGGGGFISPLSSPMERAVKSLYNQWGRHFLLHNPPSLYFIPNKIMRIASLIWLDVDIDRFKLTKSWKLLTWFKSMWISMTFNLNKTFSAAQATIQAVSCLVSQTKSWELPHDSNTYKTW